MEKDTLQHVGVSRVKTLAQYFNKLDKSGKNSSNKPQKPLKAKTNVTGSVKKREREKPTKLDDKTMRTM